MAADYFVMLWDISVIVFQWPFSRSVWDVSVCMYVCYKDMPTLPLHTHVGDHLSLAVYFYSQASWSFVAGEEPGIFPRFWTPFCLSGNWFSIGHTHLINILHEGEEVCSWLGASWAHKTGMKAWNRTCDVVWQSLKCSAMQTSVSKILIPLNSRLCYG